MTHFSSAREKKNLIIQKIWVNQWQLLMTGGGAGMEDKKNEKVLKFSQFSLHD